jgi:replication factor C small subunit
MVSMKTTKIKNIKHIGKMRVININVKKNHTFITRNGIPTHNCDRLSQNALDALKGVIEEFSNNCTFIFTSNHKYKIPSPIISRFQEIDFVVSKSEKIGMMKSTLKRLIKISEKENIEFDKKALMILVKTFFPDIRKCLNELQKLSMQGAITEASITENIVTDIENFFESLKEKDFTKTRTYVTNINDCKTFYTNIYNNLLTYIEFEHMSEAIILISKYMYESAFAVNPEITLMACAMEMMDFNWKE